MIFILKKKIENIIATNFTLHIYGNYSRKQGNLDVGWVKRSATQQQYVSWQLL
ncbi:hypothetical protein B6N60_01194 [Richelia sinica FACHB-800]|uniref:Uncharacterized protein n=1 Tax=Richelia sinica FACHB-800 TaxID=1357546 RepID=A0A975T6W4_9NOST|nr:hypothetical protein B6N60_01194 [Richelia sinica FACHB-800]